MAEQPRGVEQVVRLVVRLAGAFKVTCPAIIRLCVPSDVRAGFLTLVRTELAARGCKVTSTDFEYDDLAAKGQARRRKEIEIELAELLLAQTAPPAVTPPSPASVPTAPSHPTTLTPHQMEILAALRSVGVSPMRTRAAVAVLTGSSPTDGIEQRRIFCSSQKEAYRCIGALAKAGAIYHNVHAELLEVPGAVAPALSKSSREARTSPPVVSERMGYGHKGADFAGVEGLTERTGRMFLDLLEFAKEDRGELLPPVAQRLFRRLVERDAPYRPQSQKSVYMMVSHFLEAGLIKRVGRGAAGSRYEVTDKGRETAKRIRALLRKQTASSPVEDSAT